MAYVIWRSDAPANVSWVASLDEGHRVLREAMAACHDRSIEWCLVKAYDDGIEWETVVCVRHGDRV